MASWTTDDYSALIGLAAYHYLAQRVGDASQAAWANKQYASLLSATNKTLDATIARYHLDYVPCSILQPNTCQPVQGSRGRQLDVPARRLGLGRVAFRGEGQRSRARP